jgi:enoyl-CoA hydratase/carnithine racemase
MRVSALEADQVIARKEGPLGWLLFNNPARHNALSLDMWEAIPAIIARFDSDASTRVIIVAGAGRRAFVSGADISEFEQKRSSKAGAAAYNAVTERASHALLECSKPTLAMIRGWCIGGGVAVAICCDLRIAADNSRFGIPAARLGIGYPYAGVARLANVVGTSNAREMFYTARQYDAAEAHRIGLLNHVLPASELETYVRSYAATISQNAPLTLRAVKLCLNDYDKPAEARDVAGCQAAVDACSASNDFEEGRKAFMEKRQPVFRGV